MSSQVGRYLFLQMRQNCARTLIGLQITNLLLLIQSSQFLLVDLRCHGDSTSLKKRGPHSVASTASDVLKLVSFYLQQHVIRLFMKYNFF